MCPDTDIIHRKREGQGYFNLAEEIKILSGLEKQRELAAPSSIGGEKVLKFGQGAYDGGTPFKSVWKPGYLYLTDRRLLFFQGDNKIADISLSSLKRIMIVERKWIPAKVVSQLCLIEENERRRRVHYISIKRLEQWKGIVQKLRMQEG